MRPSFILETALYAEDLTAAQRFYGDLLGLELIRHQPGRHLFFRAGPGTLLIFDPQTTEVVDPAARLPIPPHGARGPGHICFAAEAEALEHWHHHLSAAGQVIEADIIWPGGGRSLYIRDPAGNSVEFAEPRIWD